MSPFYLVERSFDSATGIFTTIKATELPQGRHLIAYQGAKVPIEIDSNRVTVNVKRSSGNLSYVTVGEMDTDNDIRYLKSTRISLISTDVANNKTALFFSGGEHHSLFVERRARSPQPGRRLKP
ncbi:hypothetical protein M1116_00355 [Patescibacteria group bacterium]|nr:hypothetical protein [Patescibacteria group bacterium]